MPAIYLHAVPTGEHRAGTLASWRASAVVISSSFRLNQPLMWDLQQKLAPEQTRECEQPKRPICKIEWRVALQWARHASWRTALTRAPMRAPQQVTRSAH